MELTNEKKHKDKCIHYGDPLLANGEECDCHCHSNEEKWKVRFGQRFPNKILEVIDDFGSTTKEDIKGFISQEIKSTRLATLEEVERLAESKASYVDKEELLSFIAKLKNQ